MLRSGGVRVALGPGFAPGLAGLGVLAELEDLGIEIREAIGANTGALAAALWAIGSDLPLVARVLSHLPWSRFVVNRSLRDSDPLLGALRLLTHEMTFDDTPRFGGAVVRERASGNIRLVRSGSIARAVRGSLAVPGVFHPTGSGWTDPGSQWGDTVARVSDDDSIPTLWIIGKGRRLGGGDEPFSSEIRALAQYVGDNWNVPGVGSKWRIVADDPVGDLLSFSRIEAWMEAGRRAANRWFLYRNVQGEGDA